MKQRLFLVLLGMSLGRCTGAPTHEAHAQAAPRDAAAPRAADTARDNNDAPTPVAHELRPISLSSGPGALHRFRIPLQHASFELVDLAFRTPLVEALGDRTLVFNGGYWAYRKEARVIEGLVVVNDKQYAPKNANSSGGVLEVRAGEAHMFKSGDYTVHPDSALAVQCSPRLVVDGAVVPKLDATRHAARTALCIGTERALLDVYLTDDRAHPTLSELAKFLVAEGCVEALNLDGGPSTAAVAHGPEGKIRVGSGEALPYGFGVRLAAGLATKQASTAGKAAAAP